MAYARDLTSGGIRAHIRRMAVPAAVGFFCHVLYNMIDTFYAGYISTAAQSALAFSFPLYFVLLSCCVGIGQAVTVRTANAIGRKRPALAAHFLAQGINLAIAICLLIWLLLLPATPRIVALLGGGGDAREWAASYSSIIYAGAPLFLLGFILNSALQAVGNTTAFRNSVIGAVLLNIMLDPIFMFGWLGLPPLGVAGIALATLVSQACAGAYLLLAFLGTVMAQRWSWSFMRPRRHLLWKLGRQTAAPTGRMLGIGLFFFIATAFLGRLDGNAVAAYGIALRIEQLFLLPTIGLEVALLAYAGQNLGAGNQRQTRSAYRLCLRYGLAYMGIGALVLVLFGAPLISFFNSDAEVVRHGRHYLLAAAATGPCYLLINLGGALLLGALRTLDIAIVSALRLLLLPLLLFWLLAIHFGLGADGVWLGIVLANAPAAWWMHRRGLQIVSQRQPVG